MTVNFNKDTFNIKNVKADKGLIYITQDPSLNVMHFIFLNNTNTELRLTGGTPASETITGAASTLLIDFSSILTEDEVHAMSVTDEKNEWSYLLFPGDEKSNTPPSIGIAPKNNVTLAAGTTLIFTINGITCKSYVPDNFEVNYFNFENVDPDLFGLEYHIAIIKPPTGNSAPLNCSFFNPIHPIDGQPDTFPDSKEENWSNTPIPVYITYDNDYTIKNGFVLSLTNTSNEALISSGNSSLVISFLFGQNDYAITSQSLGDNIKMDFAAKGTEWEEKGHAQSSSNWVFVPQSKVLLEAHETIKFNITEIITLLNANPDTISTLYVQIQSILKYDDIVFAIDMVKLNADIPEPVFTINPPATIDFGKNVLLNWKTQLAWRISLDYIDINGDNHIFNSNVPEDNIRIYETGYKPNPAPTAEITTFTLTAYGRKINGNYDINQKQVKVNVTKLPPVEILTFNADKPLLDITLSNIVTLNYEVKNARKVEIRGVASESLPRDCGHVQVEIGQTTTFTLTATGWGSNPPSCTREITVFAYKTYSPIELGSAGSGDNMQTLPATLYNAKAGYVYVANVNITGTDNEAFGKTFQINQKTKLVDGILFSGASIALSQDGLSLFSAENCIGGSMYFLYNTLNTQNPKTIPIALPVFPLMIYSSVAKLLFFGSPDFQIILKLKNDFTSVETLLDLDFSSSRFIFDEGEKNLYIASNRIDSPDNYFVSVIDIQSIINNQPTQVKYLQTGSKKINDFARKENTIFLACDKEGGGVISIINTDTKTLKGEIPVGLFPERLLLNNKNSLLFVANVEDNTISVIDVKALKVKNTLKVGNSPSAMRISDNDELLFVTNYCDKTLTVIDLYGGNELVIGTIDLGQTNGYPLDISSVGVDNFYTDLFVAKENFTNRYHDTNPITDATLNMSVISVQGRI